jgi:archaellin
MVNINTALAGAGLFLSLQQRADAKQSQQEDERATDGSGDGSGPSPGIEAQQQTTERLSALLEQQRVTEPSPSAKDAFASAVVELSPGETAEVEVTPADGTHMYVSRVAYDRRDDHDYTINVGGDVSSVAHRANYAKPKKITQSDTITATVTNDSGTTTTLDFEIEGWSEVTGQ